MRKRIKLAIIFIAALLVGFAVGTFTSYTTEESNKTTVDVKVDLETYKQGDSIDIKIHVQGAEDEYFWLYVDGPDGRNILFRELGQVNGAANFKETINIPLDAQIGTYTIMVEWSGHNMIQITFNVEVIPEFNGFAVILVVVFLLVIIILRRRKK